MATKIASTMGACLAEFTSVSPARAMPAGPRAAGVRKTPRKQADSDAFASRRAGPSVPVYGSKSLPQRRCLWATTAAPSRPAAGVTMTCTGTSASSELIGGLSRKASRKPGHCSAGRMRGAMPPPTKTPARGERAQRQVASLAAVGRHEERQRLVAPLAAALEPRGGDGGRQVEPVLRRLARLVLMRQLVQVRPGPGRSARARPWRGRSAAAAAAPVRPRAA